MAYRNRSTHYKPRTATAKQKRAAFNAFRPLDSTAQLPAKTKRAPIRDDGAPIEAASPEKK